MGSIIDGIFGSKSHDSSSSNSQSSSGNLAFPSLQGALGNTLGFASSGGSALGALLGIPIPSLGGSGGGSPAYQYNYTYNPNTGQAGSGSGGSTAAPHSTGNPYGSFRMANENSPIESNAKFNLDGPASNPLDFSFSEGGQGLPEQGNPSLAPTPVSSAGSQGSALDNFSNSAGMNFIRDQGTKAIESSAAGRGMLNSGATGKALSQFGTNLGQTYLNDYLNHVLDYSKLGTANANVLASAGNASQSTGLASSSGVGGKNGLLNNIIAAL